MDSGWSFIQTLATRSILINILDEFVFMRPSEGRPNGILLDGSGTEEEAGWKPWQISSGTAKESRGKFARVRKAD